MPWATTSSTRGPKNLFACKKADRIRWMATRTGDSFNGADFQFLAANVIDDSTGDTVFPSYTVLRFNGIGVAFIRPHPGGHSEHRRTQQRGRTDVCGRSRDRQHHSCPELRDMGIEAIVVLLHQGGFSDGGQDDCGSGLEGAIADVAARLDDAVDPGHRRTY